MSLIGLCFFFHTNLGLTKCLLARSREGRSVEGRKKRQEGGEGMRRCSLAWLAFLFHCQRSCQGTLASHFTQCLCPPLHRANT